MVWTSADLQPLQDDKIRLDNIIAEIQANAPSAYVTVFQDPNACSARAAELLRTLSLTPPIRPPQPPPPPTGGPMKRKPKKKTSKKKGQKKASKKRKASRGKKHRKR
jgi:hypothetical protein